MRIKWIKPAGLALMVIACLALGITVPLYYRSEAPAYPTYEEAHKNWNEGQFIMETGGQNYPLGKYLILNETTYLGCSDEGVPTMSVWNGEWITGVLDCGEFDCEDEFADFCGVME
jgi:hypothetical protein